MSEDTLFWIFSTISQTMAALIAIVGVVAIFRIDNMSRTLTRLIDRNLDSLSRIKSRGALRSEAEALPKFAKHYDEQEKKDVDGNDDLATEGKVVKSWRRSEKQFAHIKTTLKRFFAFGLGTTGLSLVSIAFAEWVSSCRNLSILLVILALVGSMVTLVFTPIAFYTLMGKFLVDFKGEHVTKEMIK